LNALNTPLQAEGLSRRVYPFLGLAIVGLVSLHGYSAVISSPVLAGAALIGFLLVAAPLALEAALIRMLALASLNRSPIGPELAAQAQNRFSEHAAHNLITGVEVSRELGRRRGTLRPVAPVVFQSSLGMDAAVGMAHPESAGPLGELSFDDFYHQLRTPQVAFAVLGTIPGADVRLSERASVAISYPGFFRDLKRIGHG